jgi:hypothetical protein
MSYDADFSLRGLNVDFDQILSLLESNDRWKTEHIIPSLSILGRIDEIMASVRQMNRKGHLETTTFEYEGMPLIVPTEGEMIKIKSIALLARSAVRDYVDLAALVEHFGLEKSMEALNDLDRVCHLDNVQSPSKLLHTKLSTPAPKDLPKINLKNYKKLLPKWQSWDYVAGILKRFSIVLSDSFREDPNQTHRGPRP